MDRLNSSLTELAHASEHQILSIQNFQAWVNRWQAVKDGDPTTVAVTAVPLGDLEEASRSSISEVVFGACVGSCILGMCVRSVWNVCSRGRKAAAPPDTSMPSPVSPAGAVPELSDAPKAQADMPPLESLRDSARAVQAPR